MSILNRSLQKHAVYTCVVNVFYHCICCSKHTDFLPQLVVVVVVVEVPITIVKSHQLIVTTTGTTINWLYRSSCPQTVADCTRRQSSRAIVRHLQVQLVWPSSSIAGCCWLVVLVLVDGAAVDATCGTGPVPAESFGHCYWPSGWWCYFPLY